MPSSARRLPQRGTLDGYCAVTFVLPNVVYTGVASRFTMRGNAFSSGGSDSQEWLSTIAGEASHVLVPRTIIMPAGVKRLAR